MTYSTVFIIDFEQVNVSWGLEIEFLLVAPRTT